MGGTWKQSRHIKGCLLMDDELAGQSSELTSSFSCLTPSLGAGMECAGTRMPRSHVAPAFLYRFFPVVTLCSPGSCKKFP